MKVLHYTVKGAPRTKKNHQRIVGGKDKCPVCRKPKKQWIVQSTAHDKYADLASWQLRPRPRQPIDFPINIKYLFYLDADRIVDDLNLSACMDDLLIANGIIKDDNRRIVKGHDGTRSYVDRDNPRTEIYITRMPDEEPEQLTMKGAQL